MLGQAGTVNLTVDTFAEWAKRTTERSSEIQSLLKDIVDASISQAA